MGDAADELEFWEEGWHLDMPIATREVKCKRCGELFIARVADINRGWGKFCSKSCKAIKQTYGKDAFRSTK